MCEPTTLIVLGTALGIGGTVVGHNAQVDATDTANNATMVAHRDASLAAQRQYEDLQRAYAFNAKATQQQGEEAARAGRTALSQAIAGAGASGIDAGSMSVQDIINSERQRTASNLSKVADKQSDIKSGLISDNISVEMQAQGRINSTPFQTGPSALGAALSIGSQALSGASSYRKASAEAAKGP